MSLNSYLLESTVRSPHSEITHGRELKMQSAPNELTYR